MELLSPFSTEWRRRLLMVPKEWSLNNFLSMSCGELYRWDDTCWPLPWSWRHYFSGAIVIGCIQSLIEGTLFFDNSSLVLQEIVLFIISYLERSVLPNAHVFSGMAYKTTAVNWACFMREVSTIPFEMLNFRVLWKLTSHYLVDELNSTKATQTGDWRQVSVFHVH